MKRVILAVVVALAFQGCGSKEEGASGGTPQPISSGGPGPGPGPSPVPGPTAFDIVLSTGDSARIDPAKRTATLMPVAIVLKLKLRFASANWGFLPSADTFFGKCQKEREAVEFAVEHGIDAQELYGRELSLDSGIWSLTHDLADSKKALEAELERRDLRYSIRVPAETLKTHSFPNPALFPVQKQPWRKWEGVVALIGRALSPYTAGHSSAELTIAEVCDLLASELAFRMDTGTIVFIDEDTR